MTNVSGVLDRRSSQMGVCESRMARTNKGWREIAASIWGAAWMYMGQADPVRGGLLR